MKRLFRTTFPLIILLYLSGCSSKAVLTDLPIMQEEIVSFNSVASDVAKLNSKYGEANVLIILDIDNTLLTSSVDIGGDIWYLWQTGKLDIKPEKDQKVPCLYQDSIGLLYELLPMNLTENNLPEMIKGWQAGGNTLFALTSRGPAFRPATERELNNKGINFEESALAPKGKDAPLYRETLAREISYMKGIMMTSGLNKGEMINLILDRTGRHFDAIVFVDDSKKNVAKVYESFKDRTDIDTNIYHYVKIEKDREAKFGSILTQEQADKMSQDWVDLNKTLNAIFPERDLAEGCLGK